VTHFVGPFSYYAFGGVTSGSMWPGGSSRSLVRPFWGNASVEKSFVPWEDLEAWDLLSDGRSAHSLDSDVRGVHLWSMVLTSSKPFAMTAMNMCSLAAMRFFRAGATSMQPGFFRVTNQ
jgi:hypothetical protein